MTEKPLFPFGFGLSYSAFEYKNYALSSNEMPLADITAGKTLKVSVDVTNAGKMAGAEVAQVYVYDMESSVRPRVKELKGFEKIFLQAGETKTVTVELDSDAFAVWDRDMKHVVEQGRFEIYIGCDSQNYETLKFSVI